MFRVCCASNVAAGFGGAFRRAVRPPDFESLILARTIMRRTSTRPAPRGSDAQAIGCSRGGLSTKIHLAVLGLGRPVWLRPNAEQRHDPAEAHA